jgi:hypothetical protein
MVFCALAAFVIVMLAVPRIAQDPRYHEFADQRTLAGGIPNTLDVLSNGAFLAVSIAGMAALRLRERGTVTGVAALYVFFAGTFATFLGSTYYHLHPDDARLVYDRLGMTICFAAIVALLVEERLDVRSRLLLPSLLLLGVASIVWWQVTGDLRPYGFVQFFPMLILVALLLATKARFTHEIAFVLMGILYAAAKVLELTDRPIYRALGVSGHTLKHLVAGGATGTIAWWAYRRRTRPSATSHPSASVRT